MTGVLNHYGWIRQDSLNREMHEKISPLVKRIGKIFPADMTFVKTISLEGDTQHACYDESIKLRNQPVRSSSRTIYIASC